jgi:c-di-GMP-binding flagellar brake protein YcgR
LSNVISMDDRTTNGPSVKTRIRDRRYAIRFPFAADVELIDLETGTRSEGVTSDISMGGCFVCASKTLSLKARVRVRLTRKGQVVEALAGVRIVKPRVGMGLEFLDVEPSYHKILSRWLEHLRDTR